MTAPTAMLWLVKVSSVSPLTYRWIVSLASRMCAMRICQRLSTDMHGLPEDVVAQSRIHAVAWHEVHPAHTQATLQVLLDGDQVEQRNRPTELDEHIHIAVRTGLVAGHRAEQGQGFDAV